MKFLSRLFAPKPNAQPPEPPTKKRRTKTGRENHNWNATPERRLLKCVLGVLVRTGLARKELLAKFKELIPDHATFFDHPVTDNQLWGRADTGRRSGYVKEHPNVNPPTAPYWESAKAIVAADKPVSAARSRRSPRRCLSSPRPPNNPTRFSGGIAGRSHVVWRDYKSLSLRKLLLQARRFLDKRENAEASRGGEAFRQTSSAASAVRLRR